DMTALEEKFAQARHGEEAAKQEHEALYRQIAAQQAHLEEQQRDLLQARQTADELAREKERLEALHRSAAPPAVPQQVEANGHAEPIPALAQGQPSPQPGD